MFPMSLLPLHINQKVYPCSQTFPVIDPSTGERFADAPNAGQEELEAAIEASQQAFTEWSQDVEKRRVLIQSCSEILMENAMEIAPLLTQEQGKPFQQACGEIFGSSRAFDAAASLDLSTRHLMRDDSVDVKVSRRPLGLVAAITPWNYPIILASWKIAPALMAGNTVILKPSPYTPLSTLKMGEVLNQILPPGVLQVLSGDDELGRLMTAHPAIAKISFTGSTETGKSIARTSASDLKRLTLELGGNDPAIILHSDKSVPIEHVVKIMDIAYRNKYKIVLATTPN